MLYINKPHKKRFVEDNFDLEQYKNNHIKTKYNLFHSKNQKTMGIVSALIFLLTMLIGFSLFILGTYAINQTRIEKISEEIEDNFIKQEGAYVDSDNTLDVIFGGTATQTKDESITNEPKVIVNSFNEAKAKYGNDDIVGGIHIPDTKIAGYVVQASDNKFYLEKDLYKNDNIAGSIFMDYENSVENLSQNTIIYGHNMNDGSMFNNIGLYRDQIFFENHKIIYLNTLYENTEWEIFSFHVPDVNFNYITTDFGDEANFEAFINEIKSRSLYVTDVEVASSDKILTLSTCSNQDSDTRFVVHAKLVKSYIPTEEKRFN